MSQRELGEEVEAEIRRLGGVLHDLCQPLTAVQCRLEMAQMLDTAEDYREAALVAAAECERLAQSVTEMRTILRRLLRREMVPRDPDLPGAA